MHAFAHPFGEVSQTLLVLCLGNFQKHFKLLSTSPSIYARLRHKPGIGIPKCAAGSSRMGRDSRATELIILALSAALVSCRTLEQPGGAVSKWDKPWYYHDLDGPRFTVLNTTAHYETREYQSGAYSQLLR